VNVNNQTDYELVQEFIAGNGQSIEILINRHRRRVYTYILLIVKKQALAEDIFQDTFIKVIKSLNEGKYQDNGKFISWVTRIAHNLIIDHFRKERQLKTVSEEDCDVSLFNNQKLCDTNIEDVIVENQIHSDLRRLINELPEDQKEVILLRHYAGLSFKEIADMTDVSINTALGRMRYALINMRRLIEEKKVILSK
jgi:RNA polymerase sigma factor (sigma-70 family)